MGFGVQGLWFRVQGTGFRIFRVYGVGFRVSGSGLRFESLRVSRVEGHHSGGLGGLARDPLPVAVLAQVRGERQVGARRLACERLQRRLGLQEEVRGVGFRVQG